MGCLMVGVWAHGYLCPRELMFEGAVVVSTEVVEYKYCTRFGDPPSLESICLSCNQRWEDSSDVVFCPDLVPRHSRRAIDAVSSASSR